MRDGWKELLCRLSGAHASFGSGDIANWKRADFDELCGLGLLLEGESASHILCPECFGHGAEVIWTDDRRRALIVCTLEGRPVDVEQERLRQWDPDKQRLVALLAAGFGINGPALNLLAGQLWRLGRCNVAGRQRDVFFAAIAPDELPAIVDEIRRGYGSVAGVLFLPSGSPDPGDDSKLRIIDLSCAASLGPGLLALNMGFIEEQFAQDRPQTSDGVRRQQPGQDLRSHRVKILKTFIEDNTIDGMAGLARRVGSTVSALYGMTREDHSRYSKDKLTAVLTAINCSRAKWDHLPKSTARA